VIAHPGPVRTAQPLLMQIGRENIVPLRVSLRPITSLQKRQQRSP
jgi:hypothetical protein